jgi:hypothetical protein
LYFHELHTQTSILTTKTNEIELQCSVILTLNVLCSMSLPIWTLLLYDFRKGSMEEMKISLMCTSTKKSKVIYICLKLRWFCSIFSLISLIFGCFPFQCIDWCVHRNRFCPILISFDSSCRKKVLIIITTEEAHTRNLSIRSKLCRNQFFFFRC